MLESCSHRVPCLKVAIILESMQFQLIQIHAIKLQAVGSIIFRMIGGMFNPI